MNTQVSHISQSRAYPWFDSLGARPPLEFSLLPDVKSTPGAMFQQGSIDLPYRDMLPLFGTPDPKEETGSLVWTMSFLDRTGNCEVIVQVVGPATHKHTLTKKATWLVNGKDRRALRAVKDYVAYHLGE